MSDGLQALDMLILLILALFFISRLRNVLGKQIDDKDPKIRKSSRTGQVVQLHEVAAETDVAAQVEDDSPILADIDDPDVSRGLMDIKSAEPGFSVREFLEGAKMAFEMVLDAYVKGDKAQLRALLSKEVYADFEEAMDDAKQAETREETTLVAIESVDVVRAALKGKTAEITVTFVSEQVTVERNKDGEIVGGDASQTQLVTDEWTFARQVRSPNPNWTLVAT